MKTFTTGELIMKRTALTIAISSLLLAGGVQASTVYNQDGATLNIGGRVQAMYYGTEDDTVDSDQSFLRLKVDGEARVNEEIVGYGQFQYQVVTNGGDSELRQAFAGIKHERFGNLSFGRQNGLVTKVVNDFTDVLPEFGGDGLGKTSEAFGTGRTSNLVQYFYTTDGLVLGGQYTGENHAQNGYVKNPGSEAGAGNWRKGSDEGYALSAAYNFDMGLSLAAVHNQAGKTSVQEKYADFGGSEDAKLTVVGGMYKANGLYTAASFGYGENQVFANGGYVAESRGLEAVVQYELGKWKPSLAWINLNVEDDSQNIDGALKNYVSIGTWYYFNKNFDMFVEYKLNLLDGSDGKTSLGQSTDDTVAIAMQYWF